MAKRVCYVRLTLANGDTRIELVKTTTERYINRLISDLILPAKVVSWEVL